MFIPRLGGVLSSFLLASCVAGNALVSDLNRESRGLQFEAFRENQATAQMMADRSRLGTQMAAHEPEDAPVQQAPASRAAPPREGGGTAAPESSAASPCKVGGL